MCYDDIQNAEVIHVLQAPCARYTGTVIILKMPKQEVSVYLVPSYIDHTTHFKHS